MKGLGIAGSGPDAQPCSSAAWGLAGVVMVLVADSEQREGPWPGTGLSYNEAQMHLSSACGTGQGRHELRVARTGLDPTPLRRLTMLWGDCAEGQC